MSDKLKPFQTLPPELKLKILKFIEGNDYKHRQCQITFYNLCLTSPEWYSESVEFLYKSPRLQGPRLARFISSVCSKRAIKPKEGDSDDKKSEASSDGNPKEGSSGEKSKVGNSSDSNQPKDRSLGGLVRNIDLSSITYHYSRVGYPRLIKAVASGLQLYISPRSGFGDDCLKYIPKCANLKRLDLTLAAEMISIGHILKAVEKLDKLTDLILPACKTVSTPMKDPPRSLPPKLVHLVLAIGTHCELLSDLEVPPSLKFLYLTAGLNWEGDTDHYLNFALKLRGQLLEVDCVETSTDLSQGVVPLFMYQHIKSLHSLRIRDSHMVSQLGRVPPDSLILPPYALERLYVYIPDREGPENTNLCVIRNLHQRLVIGQFPKLKLILLRFDTYRDGPLPDDKSRIIRQIERIITEKHGASNQTGIKIQRAGISTPVFMPGGIPQG